MKLTINRVINDWKYATKVLTGDDFVANPAGLGRRMCVQDEAPFWMDAFKEFNLTPTKVEPTFKNFTGNHFLDGAYVHEHLDPSELGFEHVRCNLMLKKPKVGGNPVIDGEEIDVPEGALWLCISSLEKHGSTPIIGGERLIFSFGGLVPTAQVRAILQNN